MFLICIVSFLLKPYHMICRTSRNVDSMIQAIVQ